MPVLTTSRNRPGAYLLAARSQLCLTEQDASDVLAGRGITAPASFIRKEEKSPELSEKGNLLAEALGDIEKELHDQAFEDSSYYYDAPGGVILRYYQTAMDFHGDVETGRTHYRLHNYWAYLLEDYIRDSCPTEMEVKIEYEVC